jgi:hypothetical protein
VVAKKVLDVTHLKNGHSRNDPGGWHALLCKVCRQQKGAHLATTQMSSVFTIFPVVAVCLAIGASLLVAYFDSAYTAALNTAQDAVGIPLKMNEVSCLSSIYDCANKYLVEFDNAISSELLWVPLANKPGYSLEQRVVGTGQKQVEYKLIVDMDSRFSELGLFDYLSVGEGLTLIYPVCW